jgi:uncharacterized protein (DUF2062 family)
MAFDSMKRSKTSELERVELTPKANPKMEQKSLPTFFRRTFDRFLRIRGNPREIALGFALGIFIGMTPSMGFQIPVVVFFAALLKWNKISSVLGVWITNPATAPFIYSLTYVTGAKILGHDAIQNFNLSDISIRLLLQKAPKIIIAMSVGGVVMGLPLAVLAYIIAHKLSRRYQEQVKKKLALQKVKLSTAKEKLKTRVRTRKKRKRRQNRNP